MAGSIGAHGMRDAVAHVGYWTRPEARGRGLTSDALRTLTAWLLRERGAARVELAAEPGNTASVRVARSAGFTEEGLLRQWQTVKGRRADFLLFSLLPDRRGRVRTLSVVVVLRLRARGRIARVTELTDVESAFDYGDRLLQGERVRLRGLRDDDLPSWRGGRWTPAGWRPRPTGSCRRRRPRPRRTSRSGAPTTRTTSASPSRPSAIRPCWSATWGCGARARRTGARRSASGSAATTWAAGTARTRCGSSSAYAFREMGLHRVQLEVAPYNPAGIRAYEKAGFVEEGRRRAAVWHDGRWYDEVLMSVLDSEWAARRDD